MAHMVARRCLLGLLAAAVALSNGCAPGGPKEDKLKAQFAVGAKWPDAIRTVEEAVGPAQSLMGNCTTDLGIISFTKLPKGEYLLSYPTRGAGAPASAMPQGPEAFAAALGDAFVHSRCTRAEFQYDQFAVTVDIGAGTITSMSVSRAK
jgi:hypothetical protein